MSGPRIAVVGGGPAGLAAAAIGGRLGLDVTLFDTGAGAGRCHGGVILHHNGQRTLSALGLRDRVMDGAPQLGALRFCLLGGAPLATVLPEELGEGVLPPVAALRSVVLGALTDAVREAGLSAWRQARISGIWLEGTQAHLQLDDGSDETFDVVLACDGSRSTIRQAMALPGRADPPRDAWIRGLIPADAASEDPPVFEERWGPNQTRFGSVTGGPGPSFFWCTVPMGEWEAIRQERLDAWIDAWAPFGEAVPERLRQVEDWSAVDYVELAEVELRRWYHPPVFVLGDAAHAQPPFLGQGMNSALVDACVLVQLIARAQEVRASWDEIGATWENVRRPMVSRLRAAAQRMESLANVSSPAGRRVRDAVIGAGARVGLVGGQLQTLCSGYHAIEEAYFSLG